MRTRTDLKGIQAHWCHFMLQPGAILWFKAQKVGMGSENTRLRMQLREQDRWRFLVCSQTMLF
jgi:hypothetical protein